MAGGRGGEEGWRFTSSRCRLVAPTLLCAGCPFPFIRAMSSHLSASRAQASQRCVSESLGRFRPWRLLVGEISIAGKASRLIRGRGPRKTRVGFVFQSPDAALNPCIRLETQLTEHLRGGGVSAAAGRDRAREMLEARMRISDAEALMRRYPHEISGGQRQRVSIAIALLTNPDVLILDEPTTALDVTTQAAILTLLRETLQQTRTPVIYVSHDLRVVKDLASRVAVMFRGEIVEVGPALDVLTNPRHPYTKSLIASQPHLHSSSLAGRLDASSVVPESGCRFANRCEISESECSRHAIALAVGPSADHLVRCRRLEAAGQIVLPAKDLSETRRPLPPADSIRFKASGLSVMLGRGRTKEMILLSVEIDLASGRTTAVVGESGAGKSTLARTLVGLVAPVKGAVWLDEHTLPSTVRRRSRTDLGQLQMVFQSSTASLNPSKTVAAILRRAVRRLGGVDAGPPTRG